MKAHKFLFIFLSLTLLTCLVAISGCGENNPVANDSTDEEQELELDDYPNPSYSSEPAISEPVSEDEVFPEVSNPNALTSQCPGYDAGNDPDGRIILGGPNTLELIKAIVRDNGEGDDWPHGPYGNIHVLIVDENTPWPLHSDLKSNGSVERWASGHLIGRFQLRGDTWTGDKYEWSDDRCRTYINVGLYAYRALQNRRKLRVVAYESDAGGFGRHHDLLLMGTIDPNPVGSGGFIKLDSMDEVAWDVWYFKNPNLKGQPKITLYFKVTEPEPPPQYAEFSNLRSIIDNDNQKVTLTVDLRIGGYRDQPKALAGYWLEKRQDGYYTVPTDCKFDDPVPDGYLWT